MDGRIPAPREFQRLPPVLAGELTWAPAWGLCHSQPGALGIVLSSTALANCL